MCCGEAVMRERKCAQPRWSEGKKENISGRTFLERRSLPNRQEKRTLHSYKRASSCRHDTDVFDHFFSILGALLRKAP